jgi:signal transduction histidine kinase
VELVAEYEKSDWIALHVRDDGNGISISNQERIFDPFFTTKMGIGGSGLGLHIVHSIVSEILGGRIAVSSQEGRGTCFTLSLPLEAPRH